MNQKLYGVIELDGHTSIYRTFRAAETHATVLRAAGQPVRVYEADVEWREMEA